MILVQANGSDLRNRSERTGCKKQNKFLLMKKKRGHSLTSRRKPKQGGSVTLKAEVGVRANRVPGCKGFSSSA